MQNEISDLTGQKLNISAVLGLQYFLSEMDKEMLQCFQIVVNITYNVINADAWGSFNEETKEWNGMIQHLITGQADLAASSSVMVPARQMVIDYTMTTGVMNDVVIFKRPSFTKNTLALLHPFQMPVWLALMFSGLVLYISSILVDKLHSKYNGWSSSLGCALLPVSILCGKTLPAQIPSTFCHRIEISVFVLCSLVLNAAYTGVITSFLFITPNQGMSLLDLGSSYAFAISEAKLFSFSELVKGSPSTEFTLEYLKRPKVALECTTNWERKLVTGQFVVIAEAWEVEKMLSKGFSLEERCSLAILNLPIGAEKSSFMLPKKSKFKRPIDRAILKIKQSGLLNGQSVRVLPQNLGCFTNSRSVAVAVPLTSVMVAITVFSSGCLLSLLVLFLESLRTKFLGANREQVK